MVAVSFIHPLRSAQHQGGSNEPRKFQAGAKIRMNKMESELRSAKYELRAVKNELHEMKTRLEKSEQSLQTLVKAVRIIVYKIIYICCICICIISHA